MDVRAGDTNAEGPDRPGLKRMALIAPAADVKQKKGLEVFVHLVQMQQQHG